MIATKRYSLDLIVYILDRFNKVNKCVESFFGIFTFVQIKIHVNSEVC